MRLSLDQWAKPDNATRWPIIPGRKLQSEWKTCTKASGLRDRGLNHDLVDGRQTFRRFLERSMRPLVLPCRLLAAFERSVGHSSSPTSRTRICLLRHLVEHEFRQGWFDAMNYGGIIPSATTSTNRRGWSGLLSYECGLLTIGLFALLVRLGPPIVYGGIRGFTEYY